MKYSIHEIRSIVSGQFLNTAVHDFDISNIVFDSRKISFSKRSVFVALKGAVNDGHKYISDAYQHGIRNFIVDQKIISSDFPKANFIKVDSSIKALQILGSYHRNSFDIPIIAITGSNGKTIIKEWLAECINKFKKVYKSPLSYNSQIGVPLSLLHLKAEHEIGILEAGISQIGEMQKLESCIRPSYGILSNIGDAHDSGFSSKEEKLKEKLMLFKSCQQIIYCKDHQFVDNYIQKVFPKRILSWGKDPHSDIVMSILNSNDFQTVIKLSFENQVFNLTIPFINNYLLENCLHVIVYLISTGWDEEQIQTSIHHLKSLPNRLEIKEGKDKNLLINDSYSLDLASLQLALEYQDQYAKNLRKVLFISAFEQQANDTSTYHQLSELIKQKKIEEVVVIGVKDSEKLDISDIKRTFFESTEDCLLNFDFNRIQNSCVLIKGARSFKFENIFNHLSLQIHQTVLETNLSAINRNIKYYRSVLNPETKIMAVVKAEAYGSGSVQMAQFLESQKINYLAVALIDEAIRIRESNCQLPIMVFNIQEDNLQALWDYDLEPEIYSIPVLKRIARYANTFQKSINVHLKIDSGMHRLGILPNQLPVVMDVLKQNKFITISSIFSHLSASEDEQHDNYTLSQMDVFKSAYSVLSKFLGYNPIKHILNTAGIVRFPQYQFDMVRLGLGLYGIDETNSISKKLEKAHILKAKVLQIKTLEPFQTTGYSRAGKVMQQTKIAIISIGYADGFMCLAGNGRYSVAIHGENYPTLGNICMDVSIINITGSNSISEGDDVIIFDSTKPLEKLAECTQTISYEVISRISPRIKRVYVYN